MKQVYIASPLRGDYDTNIRNAVEYCRLASETGVLPLAPHIIFSQWCNDTIQEQRERGLKLGLALLEKSDELWVMGTTMSEGMKGEIDFAKEHGIPAYFVTHPFERTSYPVSMDGNRLLTKLDSREGSTKEKYDMELVILRHEFLKPEYRLPQNQLWRVTHGPGCRPDYRFSDTIHLQHPMDGDCMAVGRNAVWGICKAKVAEKLLEEDQIRRQEQKERCVEAEGPCR